MPCNGFRRPALHVSTTRRKDADMGRAADKKHKRRRDDAARQRLANRNEAGLLAVLGESADRVAERLTEAAPADVKAAEARAAEVQDAMDEHPGTALAAALFARSLSRATDGVRRTDGDVVFPNISRKVAELTARIFTVPHVLCDHLDAGPQPAAFRCAVCPADRLMCLECLRTHGDRHTETEEHRCDECGQVWMRKIAPVRPDALTGVPVQRTGDHMPRILPAAVLINSVGVCEKCRARAGKARARSAGTVVPQRKPGE